MLFTTVPLLLASLATAIPVTSTPNVPESWKRSMESNLEVVRRQSGLSDNDILNFALTLEHLEDTFYREGLKMYSAADFEKAGYPAKTRFNIEEISADEMIHVQTLTGALGDMAVPACKYDFGLTSPESFIQTAGVLEGIGITAYLGAAALITDPEYLTIAGSILTVEARHSSFIRDSMLPPQSPFPQAFDVPLSPMQVFTLASQVITKCPKKANLGFTAFPQLLLETTKTPVRAGKMVKFSVPAGTITDPSNTYAAFNTILGALPADLMVAEDGKSVEITIPKGIAGQSFVVLTKNASSVADSDIIAGPGVVQVQALYTYGGIPRN